MRHVSAFRVAFFALAIAAIDPLLLPALDVPALKPNTTPASSDLVIVIGFVGGFVNHDNSHHGPVQLARRIRQTVPANMYIQVFENRHRRAAFNTVLSLLDSDRDGSLSLDERKRSHIVIFGQSWGASAAVLLARDLRRQGIAVLLTVQVDSVAKIWQNDSLIPDNVTQAVNFYQTHGLIHGRHHIAAADPSKTEILGNFRLDYRKNPVQCPEASWWDRVFTPGHMQSECDPKVWSNIETLVKQQIPPLAATAVLSTPGHPQQTR